MSIVINIDQSPLTISPSNTEHIYTLSSTGYTLSNFKYLVDVYFKAEGQSDELSARLKVRPNTYGKAIMDVGEIIRTFLNGNPRFSGTTYPYLNYVAEENSIITLADAQETHGYNAYNLWPGGSPNANTQILWHVGQYKIEVGCEYYSGSSIVEDINYTATTQPPYVTIFPGVDNSLIPQPNLINATLGSGYTQSSNFFQVDNQTWYYYDLFRFVYAKNQDPACSPGQFLNAAGNTDCIVAQMDNTSVTTSVRRRKHHIDCPMIVSFLNGKNDYFTNDIYSIAIRGADTWYEPYTYSAESINRVTTTLPIVNEEPNTTFKMLNFYTPYNVTDGGVVNAIPSDARKVCFYGTSYDADKDVRLNVNNRTTEVLEYWIQDRDCINEPVHLLFMNGRGQWDTYTFGKKSTKSITLERKNYQQESSLNKQNYTRGSYQRGAHKIYETNADYSIECMSWFMDEADVEIVKELFMSQDVYIIDGTKIPDLQCDTCLNEIRLWQALIPVVVNEKEFVFYQQQYQKIFQYSLTLHYGSVKRFRTQG
jgi:hypothetical protein